MEQKNFQDLNLNNSMLFSAALGDEETCRLILECKIKMKGIFRLEAVIIKLNLIYPV